MSAESKIPTYDADGTRLRSYSPAAIERLVSLNRVVPTIRRGRIVCATFRERDGSNPLRHSAHMGQRYSFDELLPSGHHAWKHKSLPKDASEDLFVRAIFRGVALSCRCCTNTSPTG
jgi:hypothetical protein